MYKRLIVWLTFSSLAFAGIPDVGTTNERLNHFTESLLADARLRLKSNPPTLEIDDADFERQLQVALQNHFGTDRELAAPVAKKFRDEAREARQVRALETIEAMGKEFLTTLPAGSVKQVGELRDFPRLKPAQDFVERGNEGKVDLSTTLVLLAAPKNPSWHGYTVVPAPETRPREFFFAHAMRYENAKFKLEMTLEVSANVRLNGASALLDDEFRNTFGRSIFILLQEPAYLHGGASVLGTAVNELCSVADFHLRPELFRPGKIDADYVAAEKKYAPVLSRARAEYDSLISTKPYLDLIEVLVRSDRTREEAEADFLNDYYKSFLYLIYYRGNEVEFRSDWMMVEFLISGGFIKSADDLLRFQFVEKNEILNLKLRRNFPTYADREYWRIVFEQARQNR